MTTNFFTQLEALNIEGDWKIAITKGSEKQLIVSVLLNNEKVGDDARKLVPPMILKGTSQELDEGFFAAIEQPVKQTAQLFSNMESFAKSLEEAKLKSKMAAG